MSAQHSTVLYVMGPTASGKTELAVALHRAIPSEIISVDSAMIYRDMNIGTAKPGPAILEIAPHHLIDIRNPDQQYSVADFCRDANQLIDEILQRDRLPILVGGTIMYFHSLQFGLSQLPAADPATRSQLEKFTQTHGLAALHQRLAEVDPESAARIHANDPQRIQRALEVYQLTGVKLSAWQQSKSPVRSDINTVCIGLFPQDRSQLHDRISARFDQMLQAGFIEELKTLREHWNLTAAMSSMRCIGYRQAWSYLEGHIDYPEMRDQAIAATRQLAKRQLTWLRHYPDTYCIDPLKKGGTDAITEEIIYQLQ